MNRQMLGAVLAATSVAMAASAARADEWSKTYSISGRADLQVQTDDGDVNIVSVDQKQITAKVATEGYKIGTDDVRVEDSQSGDHVSVTVKAPHTFNYFLNIFGGFHHAIHVELLVPRDLDLDVGTGDGSVTVQPVAGRIRIRTGDGSIHADGLKGDVSMHTGDGSIEGRNIDGALKAESGDGQITISGRFDGLDVSTGDGGIDAQVSGGSKTTVVWNLHSGDGSIDLRIPSELRANLDLKTGDGRITLDMPVMVEGSVNRSHVRGAMNGGGGELKVTSGDGSIHLMRS